MPTFSAAATSGAGGPAARPTGLPGDCSTVLSVDDLGALFGLPIGSVAVSTIRGVPAPSVGRTERVACSYTRSDAGAGKLLDVNIGRFTDEAAANGQWKVNSAAERSGGGTVTDVSIGDAVAVLIERPTESTLLVAYRLDTLTFVLPARAAGGRPAQDVLVDLAKRIIPVTAATMPTTTPVPPPAAPSAPQSTGAARPGSGALGPQS